MLLSVICQQLALILSMLGNFSFFVVVCCFFFFQNQLFQNILSGNTIRVSISLDPDQDPHFVLPDLGPNC